jgi:hypothetical protein
MNYKDFPLDQTIPCDFWLQSCDYEWSEGQEVRPGVVFVDTTRLVDFFEAVKGKGPVVLVTAACDYSVCVQRERHPNYDIVKQVKQRMVYRTFRCPLDGYVQYNLTSPVTFERCKAGDTYSVKIDAHTLATFNSVPDEVKTWFCANLDAPITKAEWLPFGLAPSHDPKQTRNSFEKYRKQNKVWGVYVNFSPNTPERYELLMRYRQADSMYDFEVEDKHDLPADEYAMKLALYSTCLSPHGNGLDCHRTYEALHLGVVPVVHKSHLSGSMREAGLPVFEAENLFDLPLHDLRSYVESDPFAGADLSVLSRDYWKGRFKMARVEAGV